MYCIQCGSQIEPGSRFCPSCGAPVAAASPFEGSRPGTGSQTSGTGPVPPPPPSSSAWGSTLFTPRTAKLIRPRSPRAIAGVCAAFSIHYGWDLVVVRILTAVISLFWGFGILAYIICWIAIPEGQPALPTDGSYR